MVLVGELTLDSLVPNVIPFKAAHSGGLSIFAPVEISVMTQSIL
jgi:hypothetical protein